MNLEIEISRKYDVPSLDIDLTRGNNRSENEQIVYSAIEEHLSYLNELLSVLRAKVQASLRRMNLMEEGVQNG